jgi:hypothetical protein
VPIVTLDSAAIGRVPKGTTRDRFIRLDDDEYEYED